MINYSLIKDLLIIGISASIISTTLVQKIKTYLKSKKYLLLISFLVSMTIGIFFSITFSNESIINAIWVGIFTFAGADTLYKSFEGNIFESFTNLNAPKD